MVAPCACRVSARDSGKVMLDAILGEVIVTCEKLHWLIHHAQKHLKPEKRSAGVLVGCSHSCSAGVALGPGRAPAADVHACG